MATKAAEPVQVRFRISSPGLTYGLHGIERGQVVGSADERRSRSTGAKSGQPREHQVNYFHDGTDAIVIASNYGGPKQPGWYFNLKAHPECELGGEKLFGRG